MNPDAVAKNILSVGAIWSSIQNGQVYMWGMEDYSSWGPTKDGRIKPDIVACGSAYSAIASADNAYVTKSGTSMAAPSVAGSVALLLQFEQDNYAPKRMLSSTLKALVLHTAFDVGNLGPDYQYGWGWMDTEKAAILMRDDYNNKPCGYIREYTLQSGSSIEIYVKAIGGSTQLKTTICWNDPAGQGSGKDLINDLDLRIIDVDNNNQEFKPWKLDPNNPGNNAINDDNTLDNVEQIILNNPSTGHLYKLVINHKGTLHNSLAQKVSLIFTGYNTQEENIHIPPNASPLTINNTQTKFANNNIYLADYATLTITSPANVNYIAGNNIIMKPGFKAEYGSKFKAQVFDCSEDVFSKMSNNGLSDETTFEDRIILFPNPVDDHVKFEYTLGNDKIISIKLVNLFGQEIQTLLSNSLQKSGSHSIKINLADLPQGIYFISFVSSENANLTKFIKY